MAVSIRSLGGEDAPAYPALPLRASRDHPEAFATSYVEEQERSLEETRARLIASPQQVTCGAFEADQLLGIATLIRPTKIKLRHRATLAAMYVVPAARGRGLASSLLRAALESARAWGVSDVALAVTVGNEVARSLYTAAGFLSYGVEPRSLFVEGLFHDVEWLNLQLR
jgi:GNAT superfamily N-acetyltransferase